MTGRDCFATLRRYNWVRTYVSHETRVQRPLLHPIEGPLRVAAWRTLAPGDLMPEPGDFITAFSPQYGRCLPMVQKPPVEGGPLPPAAGVEGHLGLTEGQVLVCRSLP